MRALVKSIASRVLVPVTQWYLRKERTYRYKDVSVKVSPGVFHPGLFSSTLLLVGFLEEKDLANKSLLELGCGTGMISIVAAKKGARVTASDLSKKAVENTKSNVEAAGVAVEVVHSDLFDNLAGCCFDWIAINPPYYARNASNESELAWNCGVGFEYFIRLFADLRNHLNKNGQVLMVLTKGCDVDAIMSFASKHDIHFTKVKTKRMFFDGEDYLFGYRA